MRASVCELNSFNYGAITVPYGVHGRMFPSAKNVFCTGDNGK